MQKRSQSDASEQSEVTAATSGSVSSPDHDIKCGFIESPASDGGKKLLAPPPPQIHDSNGDAGRTMIRRNSESLPDLQKAEEEENASTFDMSDFGGADFYQTSNLRNSLERTLPDVPEETDLATPPSSLNSLSLEYPPQAMNIVISPPSNALSPGGAAALSFMGGSVASSSSTIQSMELHSTTQQQHPLLYSAIGSLEKNPAACHLIKTTSGREFRTNDVPLLLPPAKTLHKNREKTAYRTKRRGDITTKQTERVLTSALRKSDKDATTTSESRVKITEPKKKSKKPKKVTINQQTEERFLPVSEAYTPRQRNNIKYKPAEERTPVQKIGMGTLQRPNFKDALRRVAMIIRQHVVKIEHRFENPNEGAGLFSPAMKDLFSDEQFVTPRYKCTMVRVPMARPATVYGLRKIRLDFSIPTEEEIYEFGHQLFKSVQLSSECSIVCLIYVERLMEVAKVPLLSSTWRPIFMCGLLLASKVWQDLASWNIEFASVYPQYSLEAINRLELTFLRMVKWDLYISSSLYAKYYFALRSIVEKKSFRQRYNRMVGGVDNVAASEALKVQKRTELVKEEALMQLSRSM
jgi:hypothetical protein